MMAMQVSINAYKRFKVLQEGMFHPSGCMLKPVMGRTNYDSLGGVVKGYVSKEVAVLQ